MSVASAPFGAILLAIAMATPAMAQDMPASFHPGPLIPEYGPVADIDTTSELPADAAFKVAFDVAEAGSPGTPNRAFVSLARFLNMHVEAGAKRKV